MTKPEVPLIAPNKLDAYASANHSEIAIIMSKWTVKGSMSYLITGDQGCGKTTYFKSIIRFYDPSAALRVNELRPEMNLRYAYPNRNILSFCQTANINTQEGLDFQKKTSGTYNLIGEIASAEAFCWWIQTTKVASKAGAGTHHAQTVPALISAATMDLISTNGYTNQKMVEEMVADAIDIDIHMTREKGFRYNERITEINAVHNEDYPYSCDELRKMNDEKRKVALDVNYTEYQKRITDRDTYTYKDLVTYDKSANRYVLENVFSEDTIKRILKNCNEEDEREFCQDMERIKKINLM